LPRNARPTRRVDIVDLAVSWLLAGDRLQVREQLHKRDDVDAGVEVELAARGLS
jgi:hypothetical protein